MQKKRNNINGKPSMHVPLRRNEATVTIIFFWQISSSICHAAHHHQDSTRHHRPVLCDFDFVTTSTQNNKICYEIVDMKRPISYDEASDYCSNQLGPYKGPGSLAVIKTQSEQKTLIKQLETRGISRALIGLRLSKTLWQWLNDGKPIRGQGVVPIYAGVDSCHVHLVTLPRNHHPINMRNCITACQSTNKTFAFIEQVTTIERKCYCSNHWTDSRRVGDDSCHYSTTTTFRKSRTQSYIALKDAYDNWAPNRPLLDNACLAIDRQDRHHQWFDRVCTSYQPFICQFLKEDAISAKQRLRYFLFGRRKVLNFACSGRFCFAAISTPKLNFNDAIKFCDTFSGFLAKIDSQNQQSFVARFLDRAVFESDRFVWIGAKSSTVFRWPDGSMIENRDYKNWDQESHWDRAATSRSSCVRVEIDQHNIYRWKPRTCSQQDGDTAFVCSCVPEPECQMNGGNITSPSTSDLFGTTLKLRPFATSGDDWKTTPAILYPYDSSTPRSVTKAYTNDDDSSSLPIWSKTLFPTSISSTMTTLKSPRHTVDDKRSSHPSSFHETTVPADTKHETTTGFEDYFEEDESTLPSFDVLSSLTPLKPYSALTPCVSTAPIFIPSKIIRVDATVTPLTKVLSSSSTILTSSSKSIDDGQKRSSYSKQFFSTLHTVLATRDELTPEGDVSEITKMSTSGEDARSTGVMLLFTIPFQPKSSWQDERKTTTLQAEHAAKIITEVLPPTRPSEKAGTSLETGPPGKGGGKSLPTSGSTIVSWPEITKTDEHLSSKDYGIFGTKSTGFRKWPITDDGWLSHSTRSPMGPDRSTGTGRKTASSEKPTSPSPFDDSTTKSWTEQSPSLYSYVTPGGAGSSTDLYPIRPGFTPLENATFIPSKEKISEKVTGGEGGISSDKSTLSSRRFSTKYTTPSFSSWSYYTGGDMTDTTPNYSGGPSSVVSFESTEKGTTKYVPSFGNQTSSAIRQTSSVGGDMKTTTIDWSKRVTSSRTDMPRKSTTVVTSSDHGADKSTLSSKITQRPGRFSTGHQPSSFSTWSSPHHTFDVHSGSTNGDTKTTTKYMDKTKEMNSTITNMAQHKTTTTRGVVTSYTEYGDGSSSQGTRTQDTVSTGQQPSLLNLSTPFEFLKSSTLKDAKRGSAFPSSTLQLKTLTGAGWYGRTTTTPSWSSQTFSHLVIEFSTTASVGDARTSSSSKVFTQSTVETSSSSGLITNVILATVTPFSPPSSGKSIDFIKTTVGKVEDGVPTSSVGSQHETVTVLTKLFPSLCTTKAPVELHNQTKTVEMSSQEPGDDHSARPTVTSRNTTSDYSGDLTSPTFSVPTIAKISTIKGDIPDATSVAKPREEPTLTPHKHMKSTTPKMSSSHKTTKISGGDGSTKQAENATAISTSAGHPTTITAPGVSQPQLTTRLEESFTKTTLTPAPEKGGTATGKPTSPPAISGPSTRNVSTERGATSHLPWRSSTTAEEKLTHQPPPSITKPIKHAEATVGKMESTSQSPFPSKLIETTWTDPFATAKGATRPSSSARSQEISIVAVEVHADGKTGSTTKGPTTGTQPTAVFQSSMSPPVIDDSSTRSTMAASSSTMPQKDQTKTEKSKLSSTESRLSTAAPSVIVDGTTSPHLSEATLASEASVISRLFGSTTPSKLLWANTTRSITTSSSTMRVKTLSAGSTTPTLLKPFSAITSPASTATIFIPSKIIRVDATITPLSKILFSSTTQTSTSKETDNGDKRSSLSERLFFTSPTILATDDKLTHSYYVSSTTKSSKHSPPEISHLFPSTRLPSISGSQMSTKSGTINAEGVLHSTIDGVSGSHLTGKFDKISSAARSSVSPLPSSSRGISLGPNSNATNKVATTADVSALFSTDVGTSYITPSVPSVSRYSDNVSTVSAMPFGLSNPSSEFSTKKGTRPLPHDTMSSIYSKESAVSGRTTISGQKTSQTATIDSGQSSTVSDIPLASFSGSSNGMTKLKTEDFTRYYDLTTKKGSTWPEYLASISSRTFSSPPSSLSSSLTPFAVTTDSTTPSIFRQTDSTKPRDGESISTKSLFTSRLFTSTTVQEKVLLTDDTGLPAIRSTLGSITTFDGEISTIFSKLPAVTTDKIYGDAFTTVKEKLFSALLTSTSTVYSSVFTKITGEETTVEVEKDSSLPFETTVPSWPFTLPSSMVKTTLTAYFLLQTTSVSAEGGTTAYIIPSGVPGSSVNSGGITISCSNNAGKDGSCCCPPSNDSWWISLLIICLLELLVIVFLLGILYRRWDRLVEDVEANGGEMITGCCIVALRRRFHRKTSPISDASPVSARRQVDPVHPAPFLRPQEVEHRTVVQHHNEPTVVQIQPMPPLWPPQMVQQQQTPQTGVSKRNVMVQTEEIEFNYLDDYNDFASSGSSGLILVGPDEEDEPELRTIREESESDLVRNSKSPASMVHKDMEVVQKQIEEDYADESFEEDDDENDDDAKTYIVSENGVLVMQPNQKLVTETANSGKQVSKRKKGKTPATNNGKAKSVAGMPRRNSLASSVTGQASGLGGKLLRKSNTSIEAVRKKTQRPPFTPKKPHRTLSAISLTSGIRSDNNRRSSSIESIRKIMQKPPFRPKKLDRRSSSVSSLATTFSGLQSGQSSSASIDAVRRKLTQPPFRPKKLVRTTSNVTLASNTSGFGRSSLSSRRSASMLSLESFRKMMKRGPFRPKKMQRSLSTYSLALELHQGKMTRSASGSIEIIRKRMQRAPFKPKFMKRSESMMSLQSQTSSFDGSSMTGLRRWSSSVSIDALRQKLQREPFRPKKIPRSASSLTLLSQASQLSLRQQESRMTTLAEIRRKLRRAPFRPKKVTRSSSALSLASLRSSVSSISIQSIRSMMRKSPFRPKKKPPSRFTVTPKHQPLKPAFFSHSHAKMWVMGKFRHVDARYCRDLFPKVWECTSPGPHQHAHHGHVHSCAPYEVKKPQPPQEEWTEYKDEDCLLSSRSSKNTNKS